MSAPPRESHSASPAPSLHGFARSSRPSLFRERLAQAAGREHESARRRRPAAASRARRRARAARSARAGRTACRSCAGSAVSSQTGSAPSETSQSSASSSRSQMSRWSASSPAGHSARKSSHSTWRQMTQLESSIEPPGRVPFSISARPQAELARPCGADEPGHAGTCDQHPATSARTSACARRTRRARAPAPRGTRRACSAHRRRRRSRRRDLARRRCARPRSRRGLPDG